MRCMIFRQLIVYGKPTQSQLASESDRSDKQYSIHTNIDTKSRQKLRLLDLYL